MSIADIATNLTSQQRDYLIDHIDGLRHVHLDCVEHRTRDALMSRRLVRYHEHQTARPSHTELTDLGREVLSYVLGMYADALMRWHVIKEIPVIVIPTHHRQKQEA